MPRFYETTLSITNLHNLSISTHVNRSRMENMYMVMVLKSRMDLSINQMLKHYLIRL